MFVPSRFDLTPVLTRRLQLAPSGSGLISLLGRVGVLVLVCGQSARGLGLFLQRLR